MQTRIMRSDRLQSRHHMKALLFDAIRLLNPRNSKAERLFRVHPPRGGGSEVPGVLGQGRFTEVRTALADDAAGNGGGKGYSRKRHWPVCHLRRKKGSFEYWIAGMYQGG